MTTLGEYVSEVGGKEFRIIASLVTNANITLQIAIEQILALTRGCKNRSLELGNHCSAVAGSVLWTAARTAPDDQHKLVAFFHELRSQTVTELTTGEVLEYDRETLWRDMPTFGYTFADELHSIPCMYHRPASYVTQLIVSSSTIPNTPTNRPLAQHPRLLLTTRRQHHRP